jgi:hypothetical protein
MAIALIFWLAFFIGLGLYGVLGRGADSRDTAFSMRPRNHGAETGGRLDGRG